MQKKSGYYTMIERYILLLSVDVNNKSPYHGSGAFGRFESI